MKNLAFSLLYASFVYVYPIYKLPFGNVSHLRLDDILFVCATIVFIFSKKSFGVLRGDTIFKAFFIYLVYLGFTLLVAAIREGGATKSILYGGFFYLKFWQYFALYIYIRTIDVFNDDKVFKITLVMMVIYTSIAAILQSKGIVVLRYDDSIIQNTRHVTSTLSYNYAHLGLFQLVTIGLLLGSLKDSRAILSKIAYAILIGIGIYVLMLSGSRTGMIGTTIVGFVLFAYSKNKTSYILASLVILALLYYIGLPEVFERRFSVIAEADSTGAGRVRSWLQLGDFFHVSAINTIFGVGFMQFKFSSAIDIFHSNAGHNNFLNAYVESGIIGLLLFLNIVIAVFARLKKYKDSSPLNLSMFAIWIGLVITCISVETLSVNFALTSFMGFLFVTLGFIQNHAETKDLPHHK